MQSIINRLSSFLVCPDELLLPTLALAESGFWFKENGDEVECYHCKLCLKDWNLEDNPTERHLQHKPQCPVAAKAYRKHSQNKSVSGKNVSPLSGENNSQRKPKDIHDSIFPKTNTVVQSTEQDTIFPSYIFHKQTKCEQTERNKNNESIPYPFSLHENDEPPQRNACANMVCPMTGPLQVPQTVPYLSYQRPQENVPTRPYSPCSDIYEASEEATLVNIINHQVKQIDLNADYKVAANRMATFKDWPSNALLSPEEAVEAGLYYVGTGDKVRCAWCKGGIYSWDYGDTAMGEHRKHFPQCSFVQQSQATGYQHSRTNAKVTASEDADNQDIVNLGLNEHHVSNQVGVQEETSDWRSFNAVKLLLQMGYDEQIIERVVKKHRLGSATLTEELLDFVSDMENNAENEESIKSTSSKSSVSTLVYNSQKERPSLPKENPQEDELSLLRIENQRLKSLMTCTVCLEEPISVMFMPCRHLVCCTTCSKSLEKCPLCRVPIVGTVDSIFS